MKRIRTLVAVAGMMLVVSMLAGCKTRYIPQVREEIIDPGVPIEQEFVVE